MPLLDTALLLHGILLVVIPTPFLAADQAAAITMLDRLVATVLVGVMPQGAEEEAWQESLDRLQRKIERIGPVNLVAIEEYEEQAERDAAKKAKVQRARRARKHFVPDAPRAEDAGFGRGFELKVDTFQTNQVGDDQIYGAGGCGDALVQRRKAVVR